MAWGITSILCGVSKPPRFSELRGSIVILLSIPLCLHVLVRQSYLNIMAYRKNLGNGEKKGKSQTMEH